MLCAKLKSLCLRVAVAGGFCLACAGLAAAEVVAVSFQNGVNGYNGTFDRRVGERDGDQTDGMTVTSYFLDGFLPDRTSPDAQGLVRFDDIFGNDPNLIPPGATVLSAELVVTTSISGNAQTAGPFGVAGLLKPFSSTTSYFADFNSTSDMVSRGPWWQDGSATRPVGGFGAQAQGATDAANVASIVQSWGDGTPNCGFTLQAGLSDSITVQASTSDGWSICTTGSPVVNTRPMLRVSYTTAAVRKTVFQNGAGDYAGTSMAMVRSGTNALIEDTGDLLNPERTEDGAALNQTFLDGLQFADIAGNTSSPDDLALLKFADVFGADPNQAPVDVPVAKAWVVITTGDISKDARTGGSYSAHTMLRPWDTTSLHSSFGAADGLQVDDGDISPALSAPKGFIRGAEVWFDVTVYLEAVRTGAADYGIAIQANGTADGWQVHATGSTTLDARPRLVVYSANLGD